MTAGLETRTDDGFLQLTTDQIYWRLEQVITIPNNASWYGESATTLGYDIPVAGLTMADMPLVGLSCSVGTFAKVSGGTNSISITVIISNRTVSPRPPVTVYLFSRRRPPAINAGLEIYNSDQSIAMNSGSPILRPLGVIDQNGYVGIPLAGRTIAHIPQKREIWTVLSVTSGQYGTCQITTGYQGYPQYRTDGWGHTMVIANGSTARGDAQSMTSGPFYYQCGMSANNFSSTVSANGWRSLIIDVSGI